MFGFLEDTASALVNVAADSVDYVLGEGDGPTRGDVAKLLATGMEVAAVAATFGVAESVIEGVIAGSASSEGEA